MLGTQLATLSRSQSFWLQLTLLTGLPWWLSSKESSCSAGDAEDVGLIPGSGRSPGEEVLPPPIFLPGKSHGQRSLAGYSPWGHTESDTTEANEHACMHTLLTSLFFFFQVGTERISEFKFEVGELLT